MSGTKAQMMQGARLASYARRLRFYVHPDQNGPRCPACGGPTDRRVTEAFKTAVHPMCEMRQP